MKKGKTPEDLLAKIKKELQEDRAFLQIALLDPDPDIRAAEEARVQNVLQLAEMMEDIIKEILSPEFISDEKVLENADEEIQKFKATIGEKTEEIGKACEEYMEDVTNDRNETEDQGKKEHNIYVEYGTHTLGQSENRENIEGDWILNADGEEENEEKKEKKAKKKGKKDKKNKKDKKKKKDKKNKK